MAARRDPGVRAPARLTTPPFWEETAAAAGPWRPGEGGAITCRTGGLHARLTPHHGWFEAALRVPAGGAAAAALSRPARALLDAFPERAGVHELTVQVRNRQWASLVAELLRAYSKPT